MKRLALGSIMLAALALALGAGARGAPAARPANQITGTFKGAPLTVRSAVFLYRERADDLTILLGSTDDLCAALRQSANPRGATLVVATLKHRDRALRNAPFGQAAYPLRRDGVSAPRETKRASVVRLDASCRPTAPVLATAGSVQLTTPTVKVGGTAEGTFDLTLEGGDRIQGRFSARHCPTSDEPIRGCR
jgi:hypothetical protein